MIAFLLGACEDSQHLLSSLLHMGRIIDALEAALQSAFPDLTKTEAALLSVILRGKERAGIVRAGTSGKGSKAGKSGKGKGKGSVPTRSPAPSVSSAPSCSVSPSQAPSLSHAPSESSAPSALPSLSHEVRHNEGGEGGGPSADQAKRMPKSYHHNMTDLSVVHIHAHHLSSPCMLIKELDRTPEH